jgi:HicB-like protein involved in pilus formation
MGSEKNVSKTFPLRLPPTMRRELNRLAIREGISINSFISLAVAEKIVRLSEPISTGSQLISDLANFIAVPISNSPSI